MMTDAFLLLEPMLDAVDVNGDGVATTLYKQDDTPYRHP
jgi:hypothetical protein